MREGASLRSVTAVLHPMREGASLRSVTAVLHPTPVRPVAIRAAVGGEEPASRVRVVGVGVGAAAVAGVRAAATRASSRAVANGASAAEPDPWRR